MIVRAVAIEARGYCVGSTWSEVFRASDSVPRSTLVALKSESRPTHTAGQNIRRTGKAVLHFCNIFASFSTSPNTAEESVAKRNISVEGWHLILALLIFIGGPYYYAWDSHKTLLNEVSGLRNDMRADRAAAEQDIKSLVAELKAEREADRQQSRLDTETLKDGLSKIREAQATTTEALKHINQ